MSPQTNPPPKSQQAYASELFLGVDGGGTKTRAVIIDARQRVLGEAMSGPSNPLRVGVADAATAVREAVIKACAMASIGRASISAGCIGLAGVRHPEMRKRMREALTGLGVSELEVTTDAHTALFGATGGLPGVVVIAGTGSVGCGVNARGKETCAGGWGPLAGDEGSGAWIAKRALQQVAQAMDGRAEPTELTEAACIYFEVATPEELLAAIYAPSMTHDRIAGFAREVILKAQEGDQAAQEIVAEAGRDLGLLASTVIGNLEMQNERFHVAYVGGVFSAGDLILNPLREAITRVAPNAFLAQPVFSPAVAAALIAQKNLRSFALAG